MAPDPSGTLRWANDRRFDVGGLGRVGRLGVTALIAGAFWPLLFMPAMARIPRPYPEFLYGQSERSMPAAVFGAVDRTRTIWREWRTHRIAQYGSIERFIELRAWIRREFPASSILDRRVLHQWSAGHRWRRNRHQHPRPDVQG
jgi:hypothetical protein